MSSAITIRELAGEAWAELTRYQKAGKIAASTIGSNRILDVFMRVMARHAGKTLENDREMPVAPNSTFDWSDD